MDTFNLHVIKMNVAK